MGPPIEKQEVIDEVELRAHSALGGTRTQDILFVALRLLYTIPEKEFRK